MPETETTSEEIRTLAYPLVCALDDGELKERTRRVGVCIVRLTYGYGHRSIRLDRQEDLGVLTNIGKTHVRDAIADLRKKKILQDYPDQELLEIDPVPANWRVSPRCGLGEDGARALEMELAAREFARRGGRDFGELETTFQRDPIAVAIGDQSLQEAIAGNPRRPSQTSAEPGQYLHRPPAPGATRGRVEENPPGISRAEERGTAGVGSSRPRLSEQLRRSLGESGGKVTPEGTFQSTPTRGGSAGQQPEVTREGTSGQLFTSKVTPEVTFPGREEGQKLPLRELSSRARASDDHLLSGHPLSVIQAQLSSSSSDQTEDEGRRDDRCGEGGRWQMVGMDDELLGDVRRALGGHMESFTWYWRTAIWGARRCVAEALASVKQRQPPADHPGRFLRRCFLNEAARRKIKLPPGLSGRGEAREAAMR